jgi:hypothetical protein
LDSNVTLEIVAEKASSAGNGRRPLPQVDIIDIPGLMQLNTALRKNPKNGKNVERKERFTIY